MRRRLVVTLAGLLVAACSQDPSALPRASSAATAIPARPSTPTPAAPADNGIVEVLTTGVGAYMRQAVPVALLRNAASGRTATDVVVHFTVHSGSGGSFALDGRPVSLAPGEVLAVAALCTDRCDRATRAEAVITVGAWLPGSRPTIAAGPASYTCGTCGRGAGYGSVSGSLIGSVVAGRLVFAVASCADAAGRIVGGGSAQTEWPPAPNFSVSVLVSATPAGCRLYATLE